MGRDDILIRMAVGDDLEALTSLAVAYRNDLGSSTPSGTELRESIKQLLADPDTDFIVAADPEGWCLGYVQQRYRYSAWLCGKEAYLEDLFVVPIARRRRAGRNLVEFAVEHARQRGCRAISLDANERNKAALAIYAKLGFTSEPPGASGARQVFFRKAL